MTLTLPKISVPPMLAVYAGAAVVGALGLVWLFRNGAANAGATVARGALDVGAGAVLGVGDAIGLPRTNQSECDRALAEGRTFDASVACPAARFVGSFFGRRGDEQARPIDRQGESSGGGRASGEWFNTY